MIIEGSMDGFKRKWIESSVERNKNFLISIIPEVSSIPIPVKYIEEEDFEKIWEISNYDIFL